MPPAKLGLVYSHTGLRRFLDAIGAPRTRELFLLGRNIDARDGAGWGLVNQVVGAADLEAEALELGRGARRQRAAVRARQQARAARAARGRGALDPDVERELIALREACFHSEDFREGVARLRREAPAALAGPLSLWAPRGRRPARQAAVARDAAVRGRHSATAAGERAHSPGPLRRA